MQVRGSQTTVMLNRRMRGSLGDRREGVVDQKRWNQRFAMPKVSKPKETRF
jgi:hypothetical protein